MINPPRNFPPGVLQLFEVNENKEKTLVQELPTSSGNRERINSMRHDLLLINPGKTYVLSENNCWK